MNTAGHNERRLYTRLEKRIAIKLYSNNHCVHQCNTCNISVGGALLDIEDPGFTINSLLEVEFGVSRWHALYKIHIPAIVVRCSEKQLAVSFETLQKDTEDLMLGSLNEIYKSKPEQQSSALNSM